MGDLILTPGAIKLVIQLIQQYLKKNYEYQASEIDKVERLKDHLEKTRSVSKAIKRHKLKDETVRKWAEKAQKAVSDAEVVINNLEKRKLDASIEDAGCIFAARLCFFDRDLNSLDALLRRFDRINGDVDIIMPLINLERSNGNAVNAGLLGGFVGGLVGGFVGGIIGGVVGGFTAVGVLVASVFA